MSFSPPPLPSVSLIARAALASVALLALMACGETKPPDAPPATTTAAPKPPPQQPKQPATPPAKTTGEAPDDGADKDADQENSAKDDAAKAAPDAKPEAKPKDSAATPAADAKDDTADAKTDDAKADNAKATPPAPKDTPKPASDDAKGACPEGMVYVETDYCTKIREKCIEMGKHTRSNHPPICAEYGEERECIGERRHLRFCIDKYEFPNRKGAHPPVMVSAYDATAICHQKGKRLCWNAEWTAACEGSKKTPYPYGRRRDPTKCRVDQTWIQPTPKDMISKRPFIQDREMRKLDGSVPSGSMEECKSDFGVHDLTGNFDEWTYTELRGQKSKWAALKGGWWGPLRNACRPMTTSHPPGFIFYAVSFRCCADPNADALPAYTGSPPLWTPPAPKQTTPRGDDPINWGWSPEYDKFKEFNKLYTKKSPSEDAP